MGTNGFGNHSLKILCLPLITVGKTTKVTFYCLAMLALFYYLIRVELILEIAIS